MYARHKKGINQMMSRKPKSKNSKTCIVIWYQMVICLICVLSTVSFNDICIFQEPNNIILGIMNGHNSMASGTYKHSLGES
jgi:hypothetical protein